MRWSSQLISWIATFYVARILVPADYGNPFAGDPVPAWHDEAAHAAVDDEAALATLKAQAGKAPLDASKLGAFGFCFGGSTVLELARSGADVAGVVSLHGGLAPGTKSQTAASIKAPVLVLNGADDKATPDADILAFEKEMDAARADWQFVDFSGAVHCFAEPSAGNDPASNCRYDARAAKRAYRMMDDFFRERFAAK